jgi:hypothetical protein
MDNKRRVLLIQEPLDIRNAYEVADKLAALGGDILGGIKLDEIADVAYIVVETDASDYAIKGVARGWRIWHGPAAPLTRGDSK